LWIANLSRSALNSGLYFEFNPKCQSPPPTPELRQRRT
jgi:hypothetical protein